MSGQVGGASPLEAAPSRLPIGRAASGRGLARCQSFGWAGQKAPWEGLAPIAVGVASGGGRGLEALCVDAVGVATLKGGRDQPPLWAWPRSVWAWSSVSGRGGGRSTA